MDDTDMIGSALVNDAGEDAPEELKAAVLALGQLFGRARPNQMIECKTSILCNISPSGGIAVICMTLDASDEELKKAVDWLATKVGSRDYSTLN